MYKIDNHERLSILYRFILFQLMRIFPVKKNKIVYLSYGGKGFIDNPKYVYSAIETKYPDYFEHIWVVDTIDETMPANIKQIYNFSIKEIYNFSTSSIWISNSRICQYVYKRPNQNYIQLWHAACAYKKLEFEITDTLEPKYLYYAERDSKNIDYIVSHSNHQSKDFKNNFHLSNNTKILEIGSPRNDIFSNKVICSKYLKNKYGVVENKRIILYAPTFRDNYEFDYARLIKENLLGLLKDEYILLVKLHPNVNTGIESTSDNIVILDNSVDIQELLLISDILISDYSTTSLDFSLLKKEVYLYIPDLIYYKKDRGLNDIYDDLPFPKSETVEELANQIEENKRIDYDSLFKKYHTFYDGKSSSKIANLIYSLVEAIK